MSVLDEVRAVEDAIVIFIENSSDRCKVQTNHTILYAFQFSDSKEAILLLDDNVFPYNKKHLCFTIINTNFGQE